MIAVVNNVIAPPPSPLNYVIVDNNGLLLRSDVHTLFDHGYLSVDSRCHRLVSRRLRADRNNGDQFYAHAGQPIELPDRRVDRPGRDFLDWHLEKVFKAS